jgi:thymidylate kinase
VPLTLISGTPGAGKTSLARFLASSDPNGVHIESDIFFRFLAHRVDPSLPAAHGQNVIVVRAYVAAAVEYSAHGYSVYLDGVIGPWMLPLIVSMAPTIEYVLLHVPRDVALARTQERTSQASAKPEVVGRMHEQFSQFLIPYRKHVIQTHGKRVEEVADEFRSGRTAGAYVLQDS